MVTAAMKLKDACFLEESYDQPRQHIKKQRHYFADKGPYRQSYGFSSSHIWMWAEEWCFWTVVLEKTLESPLECKEIQPVHSEGDQPSDELTHRKRLWCWEGLGAGGEGDDRGWDDWMSSPIQWTWFRWTPGTGDGQGGLACCSLWGCKELDMTTWWVYDHSRDLYMVATWSLHDQPSE